MYNGDVISMPDKWEYPWYAAWDLAFHVLALTLVDPDFGKQQLKLMLRERYMHPNGQIPAYEWNFGDVNPPVHAWSTIFTYRLEKAQTGEGDRDWLKSCFQKLLLNFTWWVNRKDRTGRNVFEGGFLGLDNIGVFDRSAPLPTGGYLEQADGTAWMALFCQNMLEIAAELAMTDPDYADMALKFVEHFLWIASSMTHLGGDTGMWDEEDGFFYDVLRLPDGRAQRLKVRSMVGLLPLCAATVFDGELIGEVPRAGGAVPLVPRRPARSCVRRHPRPAASRASRGRRLGLDPRRDQAPPRAGEDARRERVPQPLRHPLAVALPRRPPLRHPRRRARSTASPTCRPSPTPACSAATRTGAGPIWMPVNALIIRALLQYYTLLRRRLHRRMPHRLRPADDPVPGGRGDRPAAVRASSCATRTAGARSTAATEKFQDDPHWRDCLLFYEYFHGDNGAGLGASHQTGWTGVIARLMHLFATMTPDALLESGKRRVRRERSQDAKGVMRTRYPSLFQINTRVWLTQLVPRPAPARPRSTTSPTPSWIAWRRWGSTGCGS